MEDVKQTMDHLRIHAQDVVDEGERVSVATLSLLDESFGDVMDTIQSAIEGGENVTARTLRSVHWIRSQFRGAVVCLDVDAIVAAAQRALDLDL